LRTIYCDNFEIGHSKEAFCLIIRFHGANGKVVDEVHVVTGPQGAKSLLNCLKLEIEDYERENGPVEPWGNQHNTQNTATAQNTEKYVA
jgi:hypothetical protein